jgi:hypothetical protein
MMYALQAEVNVNLALSVGRILGKYLFIPNSTTCDGHEEDTDGGIVVEIVHSFSTLQRWKRSIHTGKADVIRA